MSLIDASIDYHPTREELVEGLANLCHAAKREMPKVRRLTTDDPTPWERRHDSIDRLLTQLEAMDHGPVDHGS